MYIIKEHQSLVRDRVAIGSEEKVNDFITSLPGNSPELDEASRPISTQSCDDHFANANNVYPMLPKGQLSLAASLLKLPLSAPQHL